MTQEHPAKIYFHQIGQRYARERDAVIEENKTQKDRRLLARRSIISEMKTSAWRTNLEILRTEAVIQKRKRLLDEIGFENYQLKGEQRQNILPRGNETDRQSTHYLQAYQYLEIYKDAKKPKHISGWIDNASRYLLAHPDTIEATTKVWLHPLVEVETVYGEKLYTAVKKRLAEIVSNSWQTIDAEKLSNWLRIYAHTENPDITQTLLSAYFYGPTVTYNEKQRKIGKSLPIHLKEKFDKERAAGHVDTYYKLAYAAVSIVDDPQALLKAVEIGQFADSEILNPHTQPEYCRDILLTSFTEIDDDSLLQRVYQPAFIFNEIIEYAGVTRREVVKIYEKFIQSEYFSTAWMKEQQNRINKGNTNEARIQRKIKLDTLLMAFSDFSLTQGNEEELVKKYTEWPRSLFKTIEDPLRKHYVTTLRERALTYKIEETLRRESKTASQQATPLILSYKPGITLTIGLPNQYINTPEGISIIKEIMQQQLSDDETQGLLQDYRESNMHLPLLGNEIFYKNTPIHFWYRRRVGIEEKKHEITDLETIGFPHPAIEKGKSLQIKNIELQKEIQRTRSKFLTVRGIKIFLPNELQSLGYEDVVFKQDRGDPHISYTQITVAGRQYNLVLTRDLSLNLQGKEVSNKYLQESIHWMLLSYLKEYLCREYREKEEEETKDTSGTTKVIVTRAGHYRSLPLGYTFSFASAENCWREKREILSDESERLKRKRISEGKEPREFTYVKELNAAVGLEPVIMHFPNTLHFASSQSS